MKQPVLSQPAKPPVPVRRKRLLLFKLVALLLPLGLLALLEGGLRLAGYGHDLRLFVTDAQHPDYWVMNPYASRRYFTQAENAPVGNFELFRKRKAPGTFRVFVLGESTTIGYPYMHNGAFPRWLHYRLLHTLPGQNMEIINLSMTAVNSYTVLGFAEELVEYEPDAVLVYTGHNEYYGALGVGSTSQLGRQPGLVRALLKLRGLRLVQGLSQAVAAARKRLGRAGVSQRQTLMQRMAADQKIAYGSTVYARGVGQFESNMSRLCQLLAGRRIPVFISTLVSNEKDLKPFISADTPPAGSAAYYFQQATAAYQQGRFAQARRQFAAAKELDLLRFRAPAALNRIIRELPARYPGVYLVDAEQLFRQHSPHGILGQELLLEHVHPNLAGYALLSEAFYEALKKQKLLSVQPRSELSFQQLQKQMPITAVDSLKGAYEVRLLRAGWPFNEPLPPGWQPGRSAEGKLASALLSNKLSWNDAMEQLMNHYLQARAAAGALRVAEAVLLEYPYDPTFYQYAGQLSQQAGQPAQAALYLRRAFQLRPTMQLAQALCTLHLQLDEPAQAAPYVAYALAKMPSNARLHELRAQLQAMAQQQVALQADSTNVQAMKLLASAQQQLGNQEVARRYANRAARRARSGEVPRVRY